MASLVVAVSGKPGSGKTTYARFIAEKYRLRYISSGYLFRKIAEERGLSFEELHRLAELDPSIDKMIDGKAIEEAKRGGVVVEGHLAVWILKDIAHIKIILNAPLKIRAKRIADRDKVSLDRALREVKIREESNYRRALKYYNLDINDFSIADLVVSTYPLTIDSVKRVIGTFLEGYKEARPELFTC